MSALHFLLFAICASSIIGASIDIYVDCEFGVDTNEGSFQYPLLTLTRARDLLRTEDKSRGMCVRVYVED